MGLSSESGESSSNTVEKGKPRVDKTPKDSLSTLGSAESSSVPVVASLECSLCYIRDRCKEFEDGSLCKFSSVESRFGFRRKKDIVDHLNWLIGQMSSRYSRALRFEAADGGVLNDSVTRLEGQLLKTVSEKYHIEYGREPVVAVSVEENPLARLVRVAMTSSSREDTTMDSATVIEESSSESNRDDSTTRSTVDSSTVSSNGGVVEVPVSVVTTPENDLKGSEGVKKPGKHVSEDGQ